MWDEKTAAKGSMKSVHVAGIIVASVIGAAFLVAAIYMAVYTYLTYPGSYGIGEIEFESTRLWPVIRIVVENNRSAGMTVIAVFVNGSEVNNDSAVYPYIYPKLPVTIQPNTRTTLQIEGYYWNWSDPLGTKYSYNVTLVADDGTVFTKSKQTPYSSLVPPLFQKDYLSESLSKTDLGLCLGVSRLPHNPFFHLRVRAKQMAR